MKRLFRLVAPVLDVVLAVVLAPAAALLRQVRRGIPWLPLTRRTFRRLGFFPLQRHFYEPLFHPGDLRHPLGDARPLPGVELDVDAQLKRLAALGHRDELREIPADAPGDDVLHYHNGAFEAGDAEVWYAWLRAHRPRTVIEVGGGWSTRFARRALERNEDRGAPRARHVCVEPHPPAFLEGMPIELVRTKVEEADPALFQALGPGDVLFLDSSHVIRPQGDVLFAYLEVLPRLAPGVVVHVHDVFTPRDYPEEWLRREVRFWNEQYLLEALLTDTDRYRVLLALNLLANDHTDALAAACPQWAREGPEGQQPGSLYLRVEG